MLVVRRLGQSTELERWSIAPSRRTAARRVERQITDAVPRGTDVLLVSAHRLDLLPASLAGPAHTLWTTERTILRAVPWERGWLALTCKGSRDGHPLRGTVTFLAGGHARELSLLPRYNFWELQTGDVDGDGKPEIALCTWSKTRIVPRYARRFFIYGWDGHDVYPRWRGSRLSKPYEEVRLVPPVPSLPGLPPGRGEVPNGRRGAHLLSVEITRSGRRCLVEYAWNDFGFTGLAQSPEYDRIRILDGGGMGVWGQGARSVEVDGIRNPPYPHTSIPPTLIRAASGTREALYAVTRREDRLLLRRICPLRRDGLVTSGRFLPAPRGVASRQWSVFVFRAQDVTHARLYALEPPDGRRKTGDGSGVRHPSPVFRQSPRSYSQ